MAELQSGVLVKFLRDMDVDGNKVHDGKPVLLQIRGIIPVLRRADQLLPNQGFFLKVSDLSHALYVTLPQQDDEMVLSDKLHLGQYIYAKTLEAAYPVPLLKGIRPLPGRHQCYGNPKDLIPIHHLQKFLGTPGLETTQDYNDLSQKTPRDKTQPKGIAKANPHQKTAGTEGLSRIPEECNDVIKRSQPERRLSLSASRVRLHDQGTGGGGGPSPSDIIIKEKPSNKSYPSSLPTVNENVCRVGVLNSRPQKGSIQSTFNYRSTKRRDAENYYKGLRKYKSIHVDDDSDTESTTSTSTTSTMSTFKRRTWHGTEAARIRGTLDILVDKHELRYGSNSSSVSQSSSVPSCRYDSSDDSSSTVSKRPTARSAPKSPELFVKSSVSTAGKRSEGSIYQNMSLSSINDKILIDADMSWDCLPSTLADLGREVMRQRDIALLTAVEALQEASAHEKLLKCLSAYSKLRLIKTDKHPSVEKFFSLQDDLAQTRMIFHALTSSLQQTTDTDTSHGNSARNAVKLAVHRKKNADSWIKAALASDLNSVPIHIKTKTITMEASSSERRLSKTGQGSKPQSEMIIARQSPDDEFHVASTADDADKQEMWVKGSALPASKELENFLHDECRTWFLTYAEDYLDWVSREIISTPSDRQVPELMYQIKRVSDWLDMINKDTSKLEGADANACTRLRNKIYGILLKHMERTTLNAMAEC